MLTVDELSTLLHYIYKVYDINAEAEVTIECNPDDVTPDFAEAIGHMPVNRISMGAQTFDDERLKFIRRRHSSDEICLAVERLRQAGISNISIDLMFGFPEETMQQWQTDIEKALALNVEHISAYSLMYEEGTPLTAMLEKGDESLHLLPPLMFSARRCVPHPLHDSTFFGQIQALTKSQVFFWQIREQRRLLCATIGERK